MLMLGAPLSLPAADHEPGAWGAIALTGPVKLGGKNTRWQWYADAQARYLDTDPGIRQALIRPALGYAVSKDLSLWAGYAWRHLDASGRESLDEHRLWQDINWTTPVRSQSKLNLRSRIEQRWISGFNDVGWRFRQLVKLQRSLTANPDISAIISNDLFISLNDTDWNQRSGFDQNRFFVGAAIRIGARTFVQAGYLNQYLDRPQGNSLMAHIAQAGIRYKFD